MAQMFVLVFLLVGIAVVVASIVVVGRKKTTTTVPPPTVPPPPSNRWGWLTNSITLIIIGIIVFDFISWTMIPWLWSLLTHTWWAFATFNLGFFTSLWLRTNSNPVAQKVSNIVGSMVVLGLATSAWYEAKPIMSNLQNRVRTANGFSPGTAGSLSGKPLIDTAWLVIGGCESGDGTPGSGRQFRSSGIPVRNIVKDDKGKVVSDAQGYAQINVGDPATAKEVEGLDVLNSEEDNRRAFELLFNKYGTAPWTASASCWAEKIIVPGGMLVTLEAPVDNFTDNFPIPLDFRFNVASKDEKKYRIEFTGYTTEGGTRKPFVTARDMPTSSDSSEKIPGKIKTLRVQSLEKEPTIIKITLTPKV